MQNLININNAQPHKKGGEEKTNTHLLTYLTPYDKHSSPPLVPRWRLELHLPSPVLIIYIISEPRPSSAFPWEETVFSNISKGQEVLTCQKRKIYYLCGKVSNATSLQR